MLEAEMKGGSFNLAHAACTVVLHYVHRYEYRVLPSCL